MSALGLAIVLALLPVPSAKDRCPVCGMFVAGQPDWVASARFKDGATVYADGPKDLLRFFLDPKHQQRSRRLADATELSVKDYYTLSPIDGRKACYVLGGDILGPMGRELLPFATEGDAKAFMKDHHGTRVLRFDEITVDILRSMD